MQNIWKSSSILTISRLVTHWWNFHAGVQVGLCTRVTPWWKSIKIQKVSSLVCGFFCILLLCANILFTPIASSVLNQYSHANQYMSFHQQFFFEVIFCFQKEVTSFYRNYSLSNSRNSNLSVNCMFLHELK